MGQADVGAVTLAIISDGTITAGTFSSLASMLVDPRYRGRLDLVTGGGFLEMESGPRIAHARNETVKAFLDGDFRGEWLWMLDTDHTFQPDILERLLEVADKDNAPIVGALCFSGGAGGTIKPVMTRCVEDSHGMRFDVIEDITGGPVKVDGTGAACLLVHKNVLEGMRAKFGASTPTAIWFAEGHRGAAEYGEDIFFCLRARQMGCPIYVHTGVEAPHIKTWILDSTDFAAYKKQRDLYGEDAIKERAVDKKRGIVRELSAQVRPLLNRAQRRQLERRAS